jgi:hypothetical protein
MTPQPAHKPVISVPVVAAGLIVIALFVAALAYLNRPRPAKAPTTAAPAAEAKAYVRNLELSDVTLQASENLANQRLVELQGKITNHGKRRLQAVEVFCLFFGTDGREVHRERSFIVPARGKPLDPGETRAFRLAFDTLPPQWNQSVPRMVIASIVFAS